jgi:hypothetical protein
MANYSSDRSFTDYVHNHLAIPIIYKKLNWDISEIDAEVLKNIDMNEGIDYVLNNRSGETVLVQERFRDSFYSKYNDATLRFRRDQNPNPERIKSEFYKIKANYLVYGITNGSKFPEKRHTLTDFIKWVVLDLEFIRNQFELGKIKIVTSSKINCWIEEDVLHCPENFNPDGSSSFIPFDILLLKKLFGNRPIKEQEGYF